MPRILLVTIRPKALRSFIKALSSDPEVRLEQAALGSDAVNAVRMKVHQLVIIDSELSDTVPLTLVKELLVANPFANTAVVSPLSDEEFHHASEGLGVLCRLPAEPGEGEAAELLQKLREVL